MMDRDKADQSLDALFDAARAAPPDVPEALMAAVVADAAAQMPAARGGGSLVQRALAALGGLPALGGMVTATCVGFWLGLAPPEGLPDVGEAIWALGTENTTELAMVDVYDGGWISGIEEGFEDE